MDPWDDLLEEGRRRVKKDPWADLQAEGTARAEARNKPNRDAFAATLAEQSKPRTPMKPRPGILNRGDRALTDPWADLQAEGAARAGNAVRPDASRVAGPADQGKARTRYKGVIDVQAMLPQFAIGAAGMGARKLDALTKPLVQSHDEILDDLRRAADPHPDRGRSFGEEPTRVLDKAGRQLNEWSGDLMEQGGPLRALQIASNLGGNLAVEAAAFRGSGKLMGSAAEGGSKLFAGLPAGEQMAKFAELSKKAQTAEGVSGVKLRAIRDLLANLPNNTLNASDRNLSSAGGFADLGEQFGGDKTKGLTGLLDQISQDPEQRQLFENALDVSLGGGIDALITGAKGLKNGALGSSTKAAEEIGGWLGASGRKKGEWRRNQGLETLLPPETPPASSVTVEPGAARTPEQVQEEWLAGRRSRPLSPEQEALIAEATKRVNTPQGPEPLGPEQFLTRNAERPKATPEEVEAFLNRKKPEVPQGADPEVPANPDSWEALQAEGLARANAVTPPEQISQPPEPGFPEGRPVPRDENIPDPPVPEFEAPLHQGPYRDVPEIGTTTYRGRTKYLGDKRWAYTPTEKLEQHHAVLLQRIQTASDLEGEGARTYVHDDGWDKPKTGFVPTNDFGRGKRMGDEAQRILQLLETELKGRYNAMPPEELAARPGLVNMIFSEAEDLKPGDLPDGVWEPIPETPNALPGEEGFIDASPRTPGSSGIPADNLFGDENIGRTGQQEMFGTEDLTVPKKPLENAPGGGAPELPGKISAEEMAARPELRNPDVPVAGANDPGQETLFHPVVRDAMARAGQAAPPSSVPVAVSMGAPGPVGVIDLAAAEAMAAQLEASVRQTAPINRVSAGPADPTPVTRNGRPIPKGISTAVVRDAAAGTVGAIAGWTQGDDTDEKMLLAAGGAVVGAGASRAGTALVKAAKSLGKTPARSSMQRVVKSLAEGFDIPTREGTRWWGEMTPKQRTKAEGYLTTGPGKRIIRLRHAADVMTMFHEIGHLLETDFTRKLGMTRGDLIQGSSQQMLTELYGMGRALYPAGYSPDRYIAEGFAEWVRRYATGQDMDAIAPEVSPFIRQMLDANPKGKAALDAAKLEFAQHLAGTPEERALLQMTGSSSPASKTTEFQRNWYDRNVDIRNALEDLGITPEVKKGEMFTQNAYSLARAAAKANAVAEWALHHGVADLTTGKYLTKPLMSVFEALGPQELDEFRNYLYAERVLELQDRFYTVNVLDADGNPVTKRVYLDPVQTGMHPLDAKNIVATHREKYEDLAKTIWEHQAAMIDLRVEAGMMSPRQAQIMKEVNSKHVPLYADLDPLTHKLSGQGVSAGRLHKIKTYYGDRKDLLGSIINDTFRTYRQTMQHKATLSLVEMASRHPEGSKILTILDHPPVQRVDVDAQAALRQLADLGWPGWEQLKTAFERSNLDGKMGKYLQANAEENALANAQTRPLDNPRYTPNKPQADIDDANALVEAFQNLEGQTVHEYSTISRPTAADRTHLVMPVVKDGKQVWVQVNNVQLYDALNGIGQSVDLSAFGDAAFRIAKGMTSVFRQSATLTPAFIKRNPIRDLGTALRRTQNERFTMVGEHLIRGLGVMLNHYANTVPVHGELPPPGASRVLAQIGRQADAAARAAMRTGAGPALLGAGIGAAQGDTTDERIALGLTGAAAGLGVHGAAKVASKDVVDLYEMWMQNGGGGVSLAGLDVADPKRTINEMMRSPLEKRMVIAHPVEALRAVAQMSEVATRLGELQIVLRQQLRKGTSLGDAKAAALYAAAEVTQDFTKGGKIGMALNQVMPFFNASLVGKGDLIRDMKDPSKLLKMFGWLTVPSLALYALQHDDPEYQDAPQYEKDAGWVVIFPPKPIRDLGKLVASGAHDMSFLPPALSSYLEEMGNVTPIRYVIPKPFESGVLFGSVPERVAESVFKQNPSGTGGLDYKVFDMLTNLVQPGSLPPMLGTAIDLARNKDFTGREIVPSYLQNRPAEDQATNRTGETARTIAGATGVPAAQIEQGVTGVLGPMAQVPLNISDAAIRKVREKQGKPPMRTPPRGGYTTVPTNWNRSFGKGELSGNGEAVEQFYETLKDAKGKWSSYGDEPAGTERKQELAKDPLVQMYRTGGQGSLRESEGKMKKLRERKRLALANNDTEAAKAVDREITLYARKVMQEVARASQRD